MNLSEELREEAATQKRFGYLRSSERLLGCAEQAEELEQENARLLRALDEEVPK